MKNIETDSILARLGRKIEGEMKAQDICAKTLSRKCGLSIRAIEGILGGGNSTIEKVAVIEIALNVQFVAGPETLSLHERIGGAIRSERDKATQLEISIISGVHKKVLSVIENGRIPATGFSYGWGTIGKIEKALNFQLF